MKSRKKNVLVFVLTILILALLLGACDPDNDGSVDVEPAVQTAEVIVAEAEETAAVMAAKAEGTIEVMLNEAGATAEVMATNADISLEEAEATAEVIGTRAAISAATLSADAAVAMEEAEGTAAAIVAEAEEGLEAIQAQATAEAESEEAIAARSAGVIRSSTLIGSELTNSAGEKIGEIEEALIDTDGNVRYLIFDVEERLSAVEWDVVSSDPQALQEAAGNTAVSLNENVAWEGLPEVDRVILDDSNLFLPVEEIAGLPDELDRLLRATYFDETAVLSPNLVNPQGDDLGEVEELLIDLEQGVATYGIADIGGLLGVAENTIAIPWQRFQIDAENETFIIDADEETLTNAPVLTLDEVLEEDWDAEIREYWNE